MYNMLDTSGFYLDLDFDFHCLTSVAREVRLRKHGHGVI